MSKILALCGSLRRVSMNAALLRAAARLAPAGHPRRHLRGLAAVATVQPRSRSRPCRAPVRALHAGGRRLRCAAHRQPRIRPRRHRRAQERARLAGELRGLRRQAGRHLQCLAALRARRRRPARDTNYHVGRHRDRRLPRAATARHWHHRTGYVRIASTPRRSASALLTLASQERRAHEMDRHHPRRDRRRRGRQLLVRRLQRRVGAAEAARLPRAPETRAAVVRQDRRGIQGVPARRNAPRGFHQLRQLRDQPRGHATPGARLAGFGARADERHGGHRAHAREAAGRHLLPLLVSAGRRARRTSPSTSMPKSQAHTLELMGEVIRSAEENPVPLPEPAT